MKIIGKTKDGVYVVGDIFKMFDTTGLPLTDLFMMCQQNNMQPCWIDFYNQSMTAGWKHKTVTSRLREALCDCYGVEYRDVVISRLDELFIK